MTKEDLWEGEGKEWKASAAFLAEAQRLVWGPPPVGWMENVGVAVLGRGREALRECVEELGRRCFGVEVERTGEGNRENEGGFRGSATEPDLAVQGSGKSRVVFRAGKLPLRVREVAEPRMVVQGLRKLA